MNTPIITTKETDTHIIEIITTEDLKIHQTYQKDGYPNQKVLDGEFLQLAKGDRQCEGGYQNGQKHGVWAYYINNPHNPAVRDYYELGRLAKKEVLHQDGHHLLMVMTYDAKEKPLKRVLYEKDGKTIVQLDIFQNGLLKENSVKWKGIWSYM